MSRVYVQTDLHFAAISVVIVILALGVMVNIATGKAADAIVGAIDRHAEACEPGEETP